MNSGHAVNQVLFPSFFFLRWRHRTMTMHKLFELASWQRINWFRE
jgi:hypothetical protein